MIKHLAVSLVASAALVAAALGGGATAAVAATDTTGPNITMQPTGHIVVGAPVTCFTAEFTYQCYTQVNIRWSGSDPSGICDYQVWDDSGRDYPYLVADVGTATHFLDTSGDYDVYSENDYILAIRAMDCAGNWSYSGFDNGVGDPGWPIPQTDRYLGLLGNGNHLTSSDDTTLTYSVPASTWTHSTCACFMYGTDTHAVKAGAAAGVTYSGESFALVGAKGPTRGSFKIYQDGIYQGTFSEYAKANAGASVVWASWFPSWGQHTIKVVVVGTKGHPRVDIDGIFTG